MQHHSIVVLASNLVSGFFFGIRELVIISPLSRESGVFIKFNESSTVGNCIAIVTWDLVGLTDEIGLN